MTYHHKIRRALRWWSHRQSIKLFLEAEKIRDGLLQETFILRRSLDFLLVDNLDLSLPKTEEFIKEFDNFHYSLMQLSDRLFPTSLQDSLPSAIQCLLEQWAVYFDVDMPAQWQREPVGRSLIILRVLEELLTIALPETLTSVSIHISLKKLGNTAQLKVQINYPDISTLTLYSNLPELEYLCDSFQFLIVGKCFYRSKNLSLAWYFCW
jgi:hypothetical protein